MTVEAMSSLPLQAGGAVAAAAGRTALWAISAYMRQPLRNTALAALIGISAMAGANALYKQAHHHPAPLFGSFAPAQGTATKKVAPVMPAAKPPKLTQTVSPETTGSVDEPVATPTAAVAGTIGNDDVMAMQQKLAALGMFAGTPDGIFGPRTAKAIKAFEQSVGKTPRGLLTASNVAMVKAAPLPTTPAAAPTLPAPAPVQIATAPQQTIVTAAVAAPVRAPVASPAVTATPLPAPAPLLAKAQPQPVVPSAAPTAADAVEQVATADTEDTAVPGTETLAMTKPNLVPKRSVQTIAVRVAPSAPAPAVDDQAMPSQLAPVTEGTDASNNSDVVASVQRGLNSLGFLHAPVDGVAGKSTAKAIRNFEVYFNYDVTGRVTKQLVNLLEQNGAVI